MKNSLTMANFFESGWRETWLQFSLALFRKTLSAFLRVTVIKFSLQIASTNTFISLPRICSFGASGAETNLNFLSNFITTSFNSKRANRCPIQMRGPLPNGTNWSGCWSSWAGPRCLQSKLEEMELYDSLVHSIKGSVRKQESTIHFHWIFHLG